MRWRRTLAYMKEDLEASRPLTIKVIGRDGGYIRVPVTQNPEWYRALCSAHKRYRLNRKWRRPRTIIKRCNTLKALDRMMDGNFTGVYAERLIEIVREYAAMIRRHRRAASAGRSALIDLPEF